MKLSQPCPKCGKEIPKPKNRYSALVQCPTCGKVYDLAPIKTPRMPAEGRTDADMTPNTDGGL